MSSLRFKIIRFAILSNVKVNFKDVWYILRLSLRPLISHVEVWRFLPCICMGQKKKKTTLVIYIVYQLFVFIIFMVGSD